METFTASDLNRRRRELLDAGRGEGALVRDADVVLALVPFERLAVAERLNQLAATLAALVASLDVDAPSAAALGEAGWAATWPVSRRRQLVEDLSEAVALAVSMHDPRPAAAILDALRPKPEGDGRFDAAAVWARLPEADKEFLRGKRRRAR